MDHRPGNHSAGLWHLWLNNASCLFGSRLSADANGLPHPRFEPGFDQDINKPAASNYAYLHLVTELLTFVH